jgi:uncharacterized protein (DUF885 family)
MYRLNTIIIILMLFAVLLSGCAGPPTSMSTPVPAPATLELPTITPASHPLVSEDMFQGLSLDEFYAVSWRALALRHPETVVTEGLTDIYGMQEVTLDNISDTYQQETYALIALILDRLHSYDRASLTPEEAISYDVYEWYLQDQLAGQKFMYHDYPATLYDGTAVHRQLIYFFTDYQPVTNLQEARNYITRLNQVDTKMEQLLDGLRRREAAGITPPEFAIQMEVSSRLRDLTRSNALETPFYAAFKEKVNALQGVSAEEKKILLDDAKKAITDVVLPAYRDLAHYLMKMPVYDGADMGVGRLPEGQSYYNYLLHHYTTIDLTADEVYELGLRELERIHATMRVIFEELGYPQDEDLVQLFDRVGKDGGMIARTDVQAIYGQLIDEAGQNLGNAFDLSPNAELVVILVPDSAGGYYIGASRDGSRPAAFYAGVGWSGEQYYAMPTTVYHEAIPGHYFQTTISQELQGLPAFRTADLFVGFTEGWGLYAEQVAWEQGWYESDPYSELGFLQAQAFRAARLVVDTGLHARGWTFEEAQQFLTENAGFVVGDAIDPEGEIARYLLYPGQATSYYVGYMKIMKLRQRAMDELGDQFNLVEFHRVVLSNGGVPLEVLERIVNNYIASSKLK